MLIKIPFTLNCDYSCLDAFRKSLAVQVFGYKFSDHKISLSSASGEGALRFYQLSKGLAILISTHTLFHPTSFIKESCANDKLILMFDLSTSGNEFTVSDDKGTIASGEASNKVFALSNALEFTTQPMIKNLNKRIWLIIDKTWIVEKAKFISADAYEQAKDFFRFDLFFDQSNLTLNEIKAAKKILDYPYDSTPEAASYFDLNAFTNELLSFYLKERFSIEKSFDFQVNIPELAKIIEIRNYVKENILSEKNICLKKLCAQFHITESTFQRNLKKYFKSNYIDFYNSERLKKAYEILQEKNTLSIHDVANSLGYKNVPYFSRRFKSAFNIAPREVKKHA